MLLTRGTKCRLLPVPTTKDRKGNNPAVSIRTSNFVDICWPILSYPEAVWTGLNYMRWRLFLGNNRWEVNLSPSLSCWVPHLSEQCLNSVCLNSGRVQMWRLFFDMLFLLFVLLSLFAMHNKWWLMMRDDTKIVHVWACALHTSIMILLLRGSKWEGIG